MKVNDITSALDSYYPFASKMDFDNVGLLCGFPDREVHAVLLALDITCDVIDEATSKNCELIVTHHPIIFKPLKSIVDSDPNGKRIIRLLSHGISVISLHTNLDIADGGVNDALCSAIGISTVDRLPCGRIAIGKFKNTVEFAKHIKSILHVDGLRYFDSGKPVSRIGVCSGAGGDILYDLPKLGCDTILTGELKYNQWLDGKELGINIIEADHFCTENVVLPVLKKKLSEINSSLSVYISEIHCQTLKGF